MKNMYKTFGTIEKKPKKHSNLSYLKVVRKWAIQNNNNNNNNNKYEVLELE